MSRSSALKAVCPVTKSTSSASEISLRTSPDRKPNNLTIKSVDFESNQMTGRNAFAIPSIVGAAASAITSVR